MRIRFTSDPEKDKRNERKHKIKSKTAEQVFDDPFVLIVEDREHPDGELRYHAIGRVLLVVVHTDRSTDEEEVIHIIRQERQKTMSKERTPVNSRRGIKLDEETKRLYKLRDRSRDEDPDARMLPPEQWESAMRRDEFFRPIKKQTTVRIDADVLEWLKSKGEGHISRVNEILRNAMLADRKL